MKTIIKPIEETYTIRGEKINVVSNALFDSETGKQLFDEKLDNIAVNTALDKYRDEHGFITPERIKRLRCKYQLSQRDFASLLGWSPTTIATYETGALPSQANNNILIGLENNDEMARTLYSSTKNHLTEAGKKAFEESSGMNIKNPQEQIENGINDLFITTNNTELSGFNSFDLKKFANMVLFFVSTINKLTKTKLNKLMFYSDFTRFSESTLSISGVPYAKLPHGPVPDNYELLYGSMQSADLITKDYDRSNPNNCYYIAKGEFDSTLFTQGELEVMKQVADKYKNTTATKISNLSHEEEAWKKTETASLISYDYATELIH